MSTYFIYFKLYQFLLYQQTLPLYLTNLSPKSLQGPWPLAPIAATRNHSLVAVGRPVKVIVVLVLSPAASQLVLLSVLFSTISKLIIRFEYNSCRFGGNLSTVSYYYFGDVNLILVFGLKNGGYPPFFIFLAA